MPDYIVKEEVKRYKIRTEAAKRAMKYEERIGRRPDKQILYEFWREIEKKERQRKQQASGKQIGRSSLSRMDYL